MILILIFAEALGLYGMSLASLSLCLSLSRSFYLARSLPHLRWVALLSWSLVYPYLAVSISLPLSRSLYLALSISLHLCLLFGLPVALAIRGLRPLH
jgi:hypothetical protein